MVTIKTMVSPNKRSQQSSETMNLSYTDMVIGNDGSVLRRDQIAELRKRYGYCVECAGEPIRLFNVKKSRINPLWSQKEARSVEGESYNGQCLSCHPELDPRRNRRNRLAHMRRESSRYVLNNSSRSSHSRTSCTSSTSLSNHGEDSSPPSVTAMASRSMHCLSPTAPAAASAAAVVESRLPVAPSSSLSGNEARRGGRTVSESCVVGSIHNNTSEAKPESTSSERSASRSISVPSSINELTPAASLDSVGTTKSGLSRCQSLQPADKFEPINEETKQCRHASRAQPTPVTPPPPEVARPSFAERGQSVASIEAPPSNEKDPDADYKKTDDDDYKTAWQDSSPSASATVVDEIENVIEGLHSLVADMMGAEESDFLADIILNAMRSYPYEDRIQAFALQLITNVCKENIRNITSMIYANATRDILRAMEAFISSAEVQENGCGAILCLSVNPSIRAILVKAGACGRIVRSLWVHIDNESLVRQAVGALRSFSPEKEAHAALKKDRASTYVAQAMEVHKSDVSIQRDGCAFLSNSVVDMDNRKVAVVARDEAAAVVGALIAHRDEPTVAASAIFALKNYTYEEKNNRLLRQSDRIFDALTYVLQSSDQYECRANAAVVLDCLHLSRAEDESLEEQITFSIMDLADSPATGIGAVQQVRETMTEYDFSPKVVACCLKVLHSLSDKSEAQKRQIFGCGALKAAVSFMNRFESDSSVQEMGCWLLASLCNGADSMRRQTLIHEGSCKAIIKAMQKHGDEEHVLEAALTALSRLSCEAECFHEMEQLGNTHVVRDTVSKHLGSERVLALFQQVVSHFDGLGCDMPA